MADNYWIDTNIGWLAGYLEGEGCFHIRSRHSPIIQVATTDLDVAIKAAILMGSHKVILCKQDKRTGKPLYRTVVYGQQAIKTMKLIHDLMGDRRKNKISECLLAWECKREHIKKYKERKSYSRGAKIVWEKEETLNV